MRCHAADRRDPRARGADRARRGRGDARRRRAHVRRDRRGGEPHRQRLWRRCGIGRGDRVLWWGDTSLEAVPVFGALAKLGAVFAPLNARASRRRGAPVAEYARPRLLARRRRAREPAAELAALPASRSRDASPTGAATRTVSRPTLDERDPHVIFFTSGSTGRPKGVVLSHRANWLRTYPGATTTTGGGGTVCMFPLFHMAGWTIALGAWQAPPAGPLRARARRRDAAARRPQRHRAARLYASPRCGPASSSTASTRYDLVGAASRPTPARRRRRRSCSHAIKDALPRHRHARLLRLDRSRARASQLGDADLLRKPGSVGVAAARRRACGSTDDGEVCLRSPFLMDGYFDEPDATAEALARRLVPHRRPRRARRRGLPLDRRPRARRDPHRRRDGRAARGRAGARRRIRPSPRSRSSACPTRSGARS